MSEPNTEPVVVLDDRQCWRILAAHKVGRLVTVIDSEPEIFPINYVVDGASLVFRTAEGSKLFSVTINEHVAVEVDSWDAEGGWSVILRGRARRITDADEQAKAAELPLRPWVPTRKNHWVRIEPETISGRQFHFGDEPEEPVDLPE
ncbi:pyridoxamine 5'-phosphate oxidase family protein [Nigerium sp.]|uniref:pyridoxamine 5'-phosphate oxidase family protein n=1 Tax=Nigerium sp. TaxID=2042655 RepID=UPI003221FEEF